jgi:HK97 family phage portal protein
VRLDFFRKKREFGGMTAEEHIRQARFGTQSNVAVVTSDTALRHSAVWACLRLRGDLVSTMPIDTYRMVGKVQVEVPKAPILVNPGGERVDILEWLYSTQVDLDRSGNAFGIITERNGAGLPARIDLVPASECSVKMKAGRLDKFRIGGVLYDPDVIWHEKQYTVAGLPVGLSPVAYAAWSIGEYLSIQDFALDWFSNAGVPAAHLKNTAKKLNATEASSVKERASASMQHGGLFVTGSDWEYNVLQSEQAGKSWLEAKQYGVSDVARFFNCPGDLIDAAVQSGSITYATITQRNLQFLIHNLSPTIIRRENALSKLLPQPRFVKFNTDALLRMDPKTRAETIKLKIDSRTMAPSEARALDNLPPLTPEQAAEFEQFWPTASATDPAGSVSQDV